MNDLNPLYNPSTDNQVIPGEVQARINQPLAGGQISPEDAAFLQKLSQLAKEGRIKLYEPSSLLNGVVYDSLPQEGKSRADQNAVNMLGKIREILNLEKAGFDSNYQLQNLVKSLRLNKERMEELAGDVFII